MTTTWQIFKAANILEVIIITTLIAIGMYNSLPKLNSPADVRVFIFFCSLPVITTINCIGNVFLANHSVTGKILSLGRQVLFWFFFTAFLALLILTCFGLLNIYFDYRSRSTPFDASQVVVTWSMIAFLLNGFYILVMQVKLYKQLRKKHIQENLLLIEEIGIEKKGKT